MRYRRLASPLHAARASAGGAWCLALVAAVLSTRHPLLLLALGVGLVGAGLGAGAGEALRRAARFAVPLALLVALVNPLLVREGLTVFLRLGEVPPFGRLDLTVEALVQGSVDGARVLLVVLACALFSACIDPDELLRLLRRVSFRSALTAVLAVRLVPVLARDARRLEDARRCRPDAGGGSGAAARVAVLRAVTTGALDRAVDVAATLEVRGYGAPAAGGGASPGRGPLGPGSGGAPSLGRALRSPAGLGRTLRSPPNLGRARRSPASRRGFRSPASRHDTAFAVAAGVLLLVAAALAIGGLARFEAYPRLAVATGPAELALAVLLVLAALLPFADRRGIER